MMYVNRAVVDEDPSTEKFIPTGVYVLAHMNPSNHRDMMFWVTPLDTSISFFPEAGVFDSKEEALKVKERLEEHLKKEGKLLKSGHHPLEGQLFMQEVFLRRVNEHEG